MTRTCTTNQQFRIMVSFMEQYGDLNKPCHGLRAKLSTIKLWHQLADTLNSGSGQPKTLERWKKVWSDCKNNVKKKYFRLRRTSGTTGGPIGAGFSALELRVIKILKSSGGLTMPRRNPPESPDDTANPLGDLKWEIPDANPEITVIHPLKLEHSPTTSTVEPQLEFVNPISTSPPPASPQAASPHPATEPAAQRKNFSEIKGPLRRVKFRLENQTDRTLEYLTNSDRERRNEQRQRDEEERRYNREADIRREAMERRWQNLFERFLNVVEKLIQ